MQNKNKLKCDTVSATVVNNSFYQKDQVGLLLTSFAVNSSGWIMPIRN